MSASMTPSPPPPTNSPRTRRPLRSAPREIVRPILVALAVFVVIAGITLGIGLVTGAAMLFNVVVWLLFTVLWIAFGTALVLSPGTLDNVWHSVRELPLPIQTVVVLLFLPIMIGLWIWEQDWALPIRLVLVIAIGAWNVFLFFPRGL